MVLLEQLHREARAAHDAHQQIIEIVRDSARQQSDTLQLLLLADVSSLCFWFSMSVQVPNQLSSLPSWLNTGTARIRCQREA